ncbi:MAG: 50S ribosomal protein L20 [Rhodothermales bacterium]|nr:50S ribosomal protein L20 [Rhodothermales bacterium]MBO6780310.1 50S ribosomal protein L20 [Rhodothermales bacterium]
MPRAKNRVASRARRKRIMAMAKGYWGRRRNIYTVAKNAVEKALQYQYRDRRQRKRQFRRLWITRINAAARLNGTSYSRFLGSLRKADITLNRKVLADLAMNDPKAFSKVVETASK